MQAFTSRLSLVLVALAIISPASAFAQLTKAGVVTTLQGTATVTRASLSQPQPLKFRDDVFVQDRVVTGDESVARILLGRSEERRVGKECRSRWSPYHYKKKR